MPFTYKSTLPKETTDILKVYKMRAGTNAMNIVEDTPDGIYTLVGG